MAAGRLKLAALHPQVRALADWCLQVADYYGIPVTVTSGFRSWDDQQRLWTNYQQCLSTGNMGRTSDCMYPANRPGDSAHNFGFAWDSSVPPEWQPAWDYIRRYAGFEVLPNDIVHAQVPNWRQYI